MPIKAFRKCLQPPSIRRPFRKTKSASNSLMSPSVFQSGPIGRERIYSRLEQPHQHFSSTSSVYSGPSGWQSITYLLDLLVTDDGLLTFRARVDVNTELALSRMGDSIRLSQPPRTSLTMLQRTTSRVNLPYLQGSIQQPTNCWPFQVLRGSGLFRFVTIGLSNLRYAQKTHHTYIRHQAIPRIVDHRLSLDAYISRERCRDRQIITNRRIQSSPLYIYPFLMRSRLV